MGTWNENVGTAPRSLRAPASADAALSLVGRSGHRVGRRRHRDPHALVPDRARRRRQLPTQGRRPKSGASLCDLRRPVRRAPRTRSASGAAAAARACG